MKKSSITVILDSIPLTSNKHVYSSDFESSASEVNQTLTVGDILSSAAKEHQGTSYTAVDQSTEYGSLSSATETSVKYVSNTIVDQFPSSMAAPNGTTLGELESITTNFVSKLEPQSLTTNSVGKVTANTIIDSIQNESTENFIDTTDIGNHSISMDSLSLSPLNDHQANSTVEINQTLQPQSNKTELQYMKLTTLQQKFHSTASNPASVNQPTDQHYNISVPQVDVSVDQQHYSIMSLDGKHFFLIGLSDTLW